MTTEARYCTVMSSAATTTIYAFRILASLWLVTALGRPGWAATAEERVDHRTQEALAMDAHPLRGQDIYTQYCLRCHGADASGNADSVIPSLAGQRFAYIVRQLANFAGSQRESTTMHGVTVQPAINDPQHWVDIAAYLNRLPVPSSIQIGGGEAENLGRGIFHEQCASCHGADASGDKAGFVPSLRHQHYRYLERQMHQLAQGYRHNVDEELVLFMRSFDERDMRGTADYLSRLQGSGRALNGMRPDGVVVN
jgi:cytochrome c553